MEVVKPAIAGRYVKMLVYGRPGVGKTVLGASADEGSTGRVIIGDCEGGTMSLQDKYPDVDVVRIRNYATDCAELYNVLSGGKTPYKTVVLDSITELQKLSMQGIMSQIAQTKPDRDPDMPTIGEWGKNIEQIRKLVRYFRDLPMNLILCALEKEVKNEVTGEILIKPAISGQLADEVAGFCDVVGRLITEKNPEQKDVLDRYLVVQPVGAFVAKDRSAKLGVAVRNPTFSGIYDTIFPTTKE